MSSIQPSNQAKAPQGSERPSRGQDVGFFLLLAATALSIIGSIHYIFYVVPEEATMGILQKIFYFHAPAAYAMYIGAGACCIGSIGFLAKGSHRWDAFAQAGAELAVMMGFMVLITGVLWARKAWGAYWTWDARLTTLLLSVLMYVSYAVLRAFSGGGDSERKFAAALGVFGAANLPIIHYSVQKWGGTHPQVVTGEGGGLNDVRMGIGFGVCFFAFTLLAALLLWLRTKQHSAAFVVLEIENEAIDIGALGE